MIQTEQNLEARKDCGGRNTCSLWRKRRAADRQVFQCNTLTIQELQKPGMIQRGDITRVN